MKKSLTLVLVAALALGVGFAYASPMLIVPMNVQPYPDVPEGPKAPFSVDVVYANFNTVDYQRTEEFHNQDGSVSHTETYPWTNVTYEVVLKVTNLADSPATLYEVVFAAGEDVSAQESILGGTIFDFGVIPETSVYPGRHFGGIVNGVYLDGEWVNVTWMPHVYGYENSTTPEPYPQCLFALTQARMIDPEFSNEPISFSGPLNSDEVKAFSADHKLNGTIPELPSNASDIGIWFEGVPIAEYYDQNSNLCVTEMYINGAWVDVTGKVTVDQTQPMTTVSNMLVNEVLTFAAQPYGNMNATVGPVTKLPTWGDWGHARGYFWFPWDYGSRQFNNTFAPHESRLIAFNHTQPFIITTPQSPPSTGIAELKTGNLQVYASASNYINNQPVNGTFCNTASTATQIKNLQLTSTADGYLYNVILGEGQTFQPGNSDYEVTVAPRAKP